MAIIIILAAILLVMLYPYLFDAAGRIESVRKKRYLKRKIKMSENSMWDIEFLRKKMQAMREGFRQEYDRLREMTVAAEQRLEAENKKEDPDKTIVTNLQNLIDKYKPDIEQLKTQMQAVDSQIQGTADETGLDGNVEGYRTVINLLKEDLKKV